MNTDVSSARNCFLSDRMWLLIVSAIASGLLVIMGCGGDAALGEVREVSVMEAELLAPDRLIFIVASCNKDPEMSLLRETDVDVRVRVTAFFAPSLSDQDCQDSLEVQLQEPIGDRLLVDDHTGQLVSVRAFGLPDGTPEQSTEMPPPEIGLPEIGNPLGDAELSDLQAVANQEGISLQEAIDRYGWHNNFSLAVLGIGRAFPEDFTGAEIVDAGNAWVGFAGSVPEGAHDMIDRFTSSYRGVSVEVRTSMGFTELEIQKALPAVHFAVRGVPEALDAVTYFDFDTSQIKTTVVLEDGVSDAVLDDLNVLAAQSLTNATRENILNSISTSVVRSEGPILVDDD